jgi:RNA polymerase sigma factor (sigma-70 family)
MAGTAPTDAVRHVRRLVAAERDAQLPDAQLLEQFAAGRPQAFDALLRRHGPMVLGVCRRVLGNAHDAEDAFQATFLVLARGAASVRKPDALGSWLHGVAYRVAAKARGRQASRRLREAQAEPQPAADPLSEITGRELLAVLDEELQRLPEKHRAPLVLCHLQGHTHESAAAALGCSERTLTRRLEEARDRLRQRLERRGLGLPSVLLLAGLTQGAAAGVPRTLIDGATRAAAGALTGRAASAGASAATKAVAALVLLGGLTTLSLGLSTRPAQAERQPDPPAVKATKQDKEDAKKAQDTMAVTGRILDADGKPVAGARVAVVAWLHPRFRGPSDKAPHTTTDGDGKFRLTAPRYPAAHLYGCRAVATAEGHGLAWADIDPEAPTTDVTIRLRPERQVSGRVLTVEGAPAAGVAVRLAHVSTAGAFLWRAPAGMPVWPAAATTDAEGRFTLRGAGAGLQLWCRIEDARFDHHQFKIAPDDPEKEVAIILTPARAFEGLITCEVTGKPVAGAHVTAWVMTPVGDDSTEATTGADGRFRMPLGAGNLIRWAVAGPPDGPHLAVQNQFSWPRGPLRHEVKLTLPRGAIVGGRATEAGTGKPVAGAVVRYYAENEPPLRADVLRATSPQGTRTDAQGRFRLTIPPAPGALIAHAASADYLVTEVFAAPLTQKVSPRPDGVRFYPHALLHLDLKRGTDARDLELKLRRGVTVKGRVVTTDGKPVERGWLLAPSLMPFRSQGTPTFRGGHFELPGCDPERAQKVFLQDSENRHGAIVEISGKQAGAEVTVTFRPCGSATTRYVSPQGKPLMNTRPMAFQLVLNDGAHPGPDAFGRGLPVSDTVAVASPASDKDGRVEFTGLIPGARYRIVGRLAGSYGARREFIAVEGKKLVLPDTVLER